MRSSVVMRFLAMLVISAIGGGLAGALIPVAGLSFVVALLWGGLVGYTMAPWIFESREY